MSGPSDHDLPPADRAASDGTADGQVVAGRAASPRRDRMLSELAAELRAARDEHRRDITRLRTDLSGLSALVGDNADLLGQLIPRVNTLDTELAELAERLDTLFVRALATRGQDADDDRDGQGGRHGRDTGGSGDATAGDGGTRRRLALPERGRRRTRVAGSRRLGRRASWARSTSSPAPSCPTAGPATGPP